MKLPVYFFKPKRFWIILTILICVLFFISTCIYLAWADKFNRSPNNQLPNLTKSAPTQINSETVKDMKSLGILALGYGGAGHEGGFLTDAIQIIYIDFDTGKIALISIPRDLWIKQSRQFEGKINSALIYLSKNNIDNSKKDSDRLVYGGATGVKTLISGITGLPIDYFVAIDFVGLQRAIGKELAGIDVQVGETLDDPWYPIQGKELELCGLTSQEIEQAHQKYSGFELEKQFACRFEHIRFEKGLVHMEGGDALKYIRSRHGSGGGDFSRGKRQQEVLIAVKNKLLSVNALDNLSELYKQIVNHIQTDIDIAIIQYLVPLLKKAQDFQITNISLSTENVLVESKSSSGAFILIPKQGVNNWSDVQSFISQQIH